MAKKKVLAIVGPSCTGKTSLSLYIGRRIRSEIICCDSRNVYKYFDIGSAKPTVQEQAEVPHHLIDLVEPDENFSAAEYARIAAQCIDEIEARGNLPIVCGGTGFYARALLQGLSIPEIAPQQELREKLNAQEMECPGSLHNRLHELDPQTAQRLNPRDLFRIVRALEVCIVSGKPFSEQSGLRDSNYEVLWIGLSIRKREFLKDLIAQRLSQMMEQGLLAEVESLVKKFGQSQKLMNTVNYRDLLKYLNHTFSLDQALQEAAKHNYQLARRQLMWFKTNQEINWFYIDETSREKIELQVMELLKQSFSLY